MNRRQHQRRPSAASVLATCAGALACAGAFVGVGFALAATLGRPAPLVRVAAGTPVAAGQNTVVWSRQVLDGQRLSSLCRSYGQDGTAQSLVELSDGRLVFTGPSGVKLPSGRRAETRLELEAVLAGCSADVVRLLAHDIQPRFARGEPVTLTPDIRAGVPVYSIFLRRDDDLTIELFLDRTTLAPFAMSLSDDGHVGWSRLYPTKKLSGLHGPGGAIAR